MKKVSPKVYLLLALGVLFGAAIPSTTLAAPGNNELGGYAWSSTIGWVSMNCADRGVCGSNSYRVSVTGNGAMSGYAWSPNVGWISFNSGDTSSCPSGTCAATFDKQTGKVTGWARAVAGTGVAVETGGWGGWIHLSGTSYGVSANGCSWQGSAWGGGSGASDGVIGWLSFKGAGYGVTGTGNACVSASAMSSTLSASSVASGGQPTLTWTSARATSCSIDHGIGAVTPVAGGSVQAPPITSDTTYILTCTDGTTSITASAIATVSAQPFSVVITSSSTTVDSSTGPTLTWNTGPAPTDGSTTTCSIDNGIGAVTPASGGSVAAPAITSTTTYTITCTNTPASPSNPPRTVTNTVTVTVGTPQPNLTAGPISPTTGTTVSPATAFSATITNTGSVTTGSGFTNLFQRASTGSGTGAVDIGTAVFSSALAGNNGTRQATLSYNSFPSAGTWYLRVCADKSSAGNSGSIAESDEGDNCGAWTAITVTTPTPTATLIASPASIASGAYSTLTWSSSTGSGSTCTGTGFSTGGAVNGSVRVTPTTTSNYQIQCSGSYGSTISSATVTVTQPYQTITSTPTRVPSGGSVTVTWSADPTGGGCTVTRNGSSVWTSSADTIASTSQNFTITGQTTFSLSCGPGAGAGGGGGGGGGGPKGGGGGVTTTTSKIIVNLVPGFKEF